MMGCFDLGATKCFFAEKAFRFDTTAVRWAPGLVLHPAAGLDLAVFI
jgi:hypothetical protein